MNEVRIPIMKHLKQLSLIALFSSVLTLALGAQAASESWYVNIDGQPLGLELKPRNVDGYGAKVDTQNRFYSIQLKDFPNSTGRAAFIDGQWQGLLLHNGQLHLIDDLAATAHEVQQSRFVAQTLNQDMSLGQCGFTPKAPNQSLSNITPRSLTTNTLQIDYDSYCTDTVDGVCLVGQLTLVFDSQFESDFGASYQAQAVAIAEYVDLIYQSEFNIELTLVDQIHVLCNGDGLCLIAGAKVRLELAIKNEGELSYQADSIHRICTIGVVVDLQSIGGQRARSNVA